MSPDDDDDYSDIFVHSGSDDDSGTDTEASDFDTDDEIEVQQRPARSKSSSSFLESERPRPAASFTFRVDAEWLKGARVVDKVLCVLSVMTALGIDTVSFLFALSWGDDECIQNPTVRTERTRMMGSELLPKILNHWWHPPKNKRAGGSRSQGARTTLEPFVSRCFSDLAKKELQNVSSIFATAWRGAEDLAEEELTGVSFSDDECHAASLALSLWSFLAHLVSAERHGRPKILLIILSMLCYARSSVFSRYQKLFAVYFKFHGITAKAFDTLHALGITMSHRWTCMAVSQMSKLAMNEVNILKAIYAWILSYNNITLPFKVYSQRSDNQTEFGVGTAATVYIKRNAEALSSTANHDLQVTRAAGMLNPITELEIFDLAHSSMKIIEAHMKHSVLQFLFEDPSFKFSEYSAHDSPLFAPPPAVEELPIGPDHITLQYLLGTVNIPEASYEDNSRLIQEWLKQLGLDTPDHIQSLSFNKVLAWVGDQLTIDRLRKLFKFRSEDLNSFDRLDWVLLIFGWLHLMMAYANSLHKQYLGTGRGRGLSHAFDLLAKRGLGTSSIQGPLLD